MVRWECKRQSTAGEKKESLSRVGEHNRFHFSDYHAMTAGCLKLPSQKGVLVEGWRNSRALLDENSIYDVVVAFLRRVVERQVPFTVPEAWKCEARHRDSNDALPALQSIGGRCSFKDLRKNGALGVLESLKKLPARKNPLHLQDEANSHIYFCIEFLKQRLFSGGT